MTWLERRPPHAGDFARIQPRHDRQTLGFRHMSPLRDFIERASAAQADFCRLMQDAEFYAGGKGFGHGRCVASFGSFATERMCGITDRGIEKCCAAIQTWVEEGLLGKLFCGGRT